jgi:hypothetical protein
LTGCQVSDVIEVAFQERGGQSFATGRVDPLADHGDRAFATDCDFFRLAADHGLHVETTCVSA